MQKTRETEETLEPDDIVHPSRRVAAIIGALMFLVVVAAAVVFVLRANSSSADDSAAGPAVNVVASPTLDGQAALPAVSGSAAGAVVTGTGPASTPASVLPSAPASAPPSAPASVAPTGPVTDILVQGTVRMGLVTGQPREAFDLDLAVKDDPAQNSDWQPDLLAADTGFTGMNGAQFAPWTQAGKPTHTGCAAMPAAQWVTAIPLAKLLPGSKWCVRTSSERVASIVVGGGTVLTDGDIYSTYLDFVTWKKPVE